jgi:hypothetical protein
MHPARIVPLSRMTKGIVVMILLGGLLAVAACGEVVPLQELACPCASGWTCCSGVCVVGSCQDGGGDTLTCSGSIDLGAQTIAQESDAAITPGVEQVTGRSAGALPLGQQVPFDYASSAWPTPQGWELSGWLVEATANQTFALQVWAEQDAGADPLPVVAYGPIADVGTSSCSAALQSPGVMLGSQVQWTASGEGTYFIAAYHQVSETPSGLAFQGLDNTLYGHAFIVMQPTE